MSTDYWFSIDPAKLAEGLAHLAAFFTVPLFTESLAAREVNAVDSEYKRNQQNDARRVLQLTRHLSAPGHPTRLFGTGNHASLSRVGRCAGADDTDDATAMKETRRRLVEWWAQNYCAARMTLVVLGRGPSHPRRVARPALLAHALSPGPQMP